MVDKSTWRSLHPLNDCSAERWVIHDPIVKNQTVSCCSSGEILARFELQTNIHRSSLQKFVLSGAVDDGEWRVILKFTSGNGRLLLFAVVFWLEVGIHVVEKSDLVVGEIQIEISTVSWGRTSHREVWHDQSDWHFDPPCFVDWSGSLRWQSEASPMSKRFSWPTQVWLF